jgi:hypothetical protein
MRLTLPTEMARRKDHDQIDSELLFSSERIRSLLWGKQAKGGLREGIQSRDYRAWDSDLGSKDWLKPREMGPMSIEWRLKSQKETAVQEAAIAKITFTHDNMLMEGKPWS